MKQNTTKVLVVDDEQNVRSALQRVLENSGHEVITAADGDRALALVAEQNPDLVLLDIKMPGKSGIDVLEELRGKHPDTAVIMITAIADINVAVKALTDGAYGYLNKPFNINELTVIVERALERRGLLLRNREYQLNLESKVQEQTQSLQQKVREVTALNNLFTKCLNQGFEAADKYVRLASEIVTVCEEIKTVARQASGDFDKNISSHAGDIIKKAEEIRALAREAQAMRIGMSASAETGGHRE